MSEINIEIYKFTTLQVKWLTLGGLNREIRKYKTLECSTTYFNRCQENREIRVQLEKLLSVS